MATKRRLSRKAIGILRWVQKQITEEPLRADMGVLWVKGRDAKNHYREVPKCGTVGCICGWINHHPSNQVKRVSIDRMEARACVLLELKPSPENNISLYQLFYMQWPFDLKYKLNVARHQTPEHAAVVCEAIDRWIAGDGAFV